MIISDKWRAPAGERRYVATEKELSEPGWREYGGKGYAYWMLARQIEDEFGDEPATIREIYESVTSPLGLSSSDTIALVKAAKREGYLA